MEYEMPKMSESDPTQKKNWRYKNPSIIAFLMKKKENLAQIIDQLEYWKTWALEIVLWLFACYWEWITLEFNLRMSHWIIRYDSRILADKFIKLKSKNIIFTPRWWLNRLNEFNFRFLSPDILFLFGHPKILLSDSWWSFITACLSCHTLTNSSKFILVDLKLFLDEI